MAPQSSFQSFRMISQKMGAPLRHLDDAVKTSLL
jgi:hypothetical protein